MIERKSIDIAWAAAEASNEARDQFKATEQDAVELTRLRNLGLPGVTIEPAAQEAMEKRVTATEWEFKLLLNMAGLVTRGGDTNPFLEPTVSYSTEYLLEQNLITWALDRQTGERHPFIGEEEFKHLALLAKPTIKKHGLRQAFRTFATDNYSHRGTFEGYGATVWMTNNLHDRELNYRRESEDELAPSRSMIKADKLTELAAFADELLNQRGRADNPDLPKINGLTPKALEILTCVAQLVGRHPGLLEPPTQVS